VAELEPLAFILSRLLNQLCARLSTRGLGAKEVRLDLELDKERVDPPAPGPESRSLTLPVPTQDSRLLLKLWRLHLEGKPPQAPVLKVAFTAQAAKPRALARSLFLPAAPDLEKLELTLARIRGLVGEGKAGALDALDTHRPDAFQVRPFSEAARGRSPVPPVRSGTGRSRSAPARHRELRTSAARMALRLFRPPLAARVELRDERPVRIEAACGVRGQVIVASGPWRTSGEWWREASWAEDEWDIEVRSVTRGGPSKPTVERKSLYRIFREHSSGQWFIRGTYD
jgi:protein ImuB